MPITDYHADPADGMILFAVGQQNIIITYEEDEIKHILSIINRNSIIGKRDYLIILIAAEYGWRASDIVNFKFGQIDWDKNEISYQQKKTDNPVVYPLLSSVGNAIVYYLKNGRPKTASDEIIVSAESSKRGQKMCAQTIHSIVTKYMRAANIKDWHTKKHGPHSLRFSMATNMLKRNVAMPVISAVLGHKSTESTKTYLAVDIESLRKCPLPIPSIKSEFYEVRA
jgi:site-specific recombinase XerD